MSWLADLFRDFRYSARALSRTPGFAVVAVVVLALGIGANSAIFSLVSAVWLRPLPFADAERLVTLWVDLTEIGGPSGVNIAPGHYVAAVRSNPATRRRTPSSSARAFGYVALLATPRPSAARSP